MTPHDLMRALGLLALLWLAVGVGCAVAALMPGHRRRP